MKPRKRLLGRIWAQAYKDCFRLGHTRVLVTQKELNALLVAYICDAIPAINDASNTLGIRAPEVCDKVAGIREAPGISKTVREAPGISKAAREAHEAQEGINEAQEGISEAHEAQGISEAHVAQGINEAHEAQGINEAHEAQGVLEIADAEAHMHELAVVPKDPHQLLSMDNAVVVTKERRRELLEELCKEFARPEKRPKFKKQSRSIA